MIKCWGVLGPAVISLQATKKSLQSLTSSLVPTPPNTQVQRLSIEIWGCSTAWTSTSLWPLQHIRNIKTVMHGTQLERANDIHDSLQQLIVSQDALHHAVIPVHLPTILLLSHGVFSLPTVRSS